MTDNRKMADAAVATHERFWDETPPAVLEPVALAQYGEDFDAGTATLEYAHDEDGFEKGDEEV